MWMKVPPFVMRGMMCKVRWWTTMLNNQQMQQQRCPLSCDQVFNNKN
jgi:hypothetical protein